MGSVIACWLMTMFKPLSFRARVMVLATGMGVLLSAMFAVAVVVITEHYEHVLVGALLQDQADAWAERLSHDPNAVLPSSDRQRAHLRPMGSAGNVPARLAALPPGVHEFEDDGDGVHVGVFDTSAGRIYLEIDLRDIEALERYLHRILLIVIIAGTLLSALLGWWLARSATRPLRRLANAVEGLGPMPQATHLAAAQPRDELGRLAQAIDGYQQRLVEAQQVERTFFADASHELRTPVAVVRGALELLEEDVRSQPRLQEPMQRLRRGVDETSALLDALLRLARRQLADAETVDVDAWARDFFDAAVQGRTPPVAIIVEGHAGRQPLPVRDAELVLAALLRSLLAKPATGLLAVELSPQGIGMKLRSDAHPASASASSHRHGEGHTRSDRGLGNSLIGRLAAAHGWRIEIHDDDHIRLHWRDE